MEGDSVLNWWQWAIYGAVCFLVLVALMWIGFRLFFEEKARSLRHMLGGDDEPEVEAQMKRKGER
jgi:Na+/H+ antiporter NhaC